MAAITITKDEVKKYAAEIEAGVAKIRSTKEWKDMLNFNSKFWQYSHQNCWLIAMQTQGKATRVAGFQTWKKLGASVKKGEKAIRILAPMRRKVEDKNGEDAYAITGFRTVCVFDISQTDCKVPDNYWHPVEGACQRARELREAVEKLEFVGVQEERTDCEGYYRPSTGDIKIKSGVPDNAFMSVFFHEYAHKTVHETVKINLDRDREEVVAESCAYMLAQLAGIDTQNSNFAYVSSWLGNKGDKLGELVSTIQQVVKAAAEGIEKATGMKLAPSQLEPAD